MTETLHRGQITEKLQIHNFISKRKKVWFPVEIFQILQNKNENRD